MYLLTLAFATAYYTSYSYIEPFLSQIAGMHNELITATLMFFGAAGILGSVLFSKFYGVNRKRLLLHYVYFYYTLFLSIMY